jgi:hypothetical protein
LQEIRWLPSDCQKALNRLICNAKLAPEWNIYKTEAMHAMDKRLQNWISSNICQHEFATLSELRDISGKDGVSVDKIVNVAELIDDKPLYGNCYEENSVLIVNADIPEPSEALTILRNAVRKKYENSNNKQVRVKESNGESLQGITLDPLLGLETDDQRTVFNSIRKGWSELLWLGACNNTNDTNMPDMLYTSARERMVAYLPSNCMSGNTKYLAQNAVQPLYLNLDTYAVRRAATRMHGVVGCGMEAGCTVYTKGPLYKSVKELAIEGNLYSTLGRKRLLSEAKQYKAIKVTHIQTLATNICTKGDRGCLEQSYTYAIAREILHDLVEAGNPDERQDDSQHDCYFRAVYDSTMYADKVPLNTLHCDGKVMLAGTQAGIMQKDPSSKQTEIGIYLAVHNPINSTDWDNIQSVYARNKQTKVKLQIEDDDTVTTVKLITFQYGNDGANGHLVKKNRYSNLQNVYDCVGGFCVGMQ